MRHLDAVILDLDCLVVEFKELQALAWCKALAEQGFSISIEQILPLNGLAEEEVLTRLTGLTLGSKAGQLTCERYLEILNGSLSTKELPVLAGTKELLKKWRHEGLHIAVITQALGGKLKTRFEEVRLEELPLEELKLNPSTYNSTSSTDVMETVLNKLGYEAGRVVFVGGTSHYLRLALKHGIPTIGLGCGEPTSESQPLAWATEFYNDPAHLLEQYENSRLGSSPIRLVES